MCCCDAILNIEFSAQFKERIKNKRRLLSVARYCSFKSDNIGITFTIFENFPLNLPFEPIADASDSKYTVIMRL